jgi:hypothetical protein
LRAGAIVLFPVVALGAWQANGGRGAVRPVDWALAIGVSAAGLAVLGVSMSAWGAFTAARVQPWLTAQLPWDLLGFLEDAHRRGILRQSGAYYRFRHVRLQERLSARARHSSVSHRTVRTRRSGEWLTPGSPRVNSKRFLPGLVLGLGIALLWTEAPLLPGTPGPRTVVRPACELVDQTALSSLLPEPKAIGEPDGSFMCWWEDKDWHVPGNPMVIVETETLTPLLQHSAVERAEQRFETKSDESIHQARYARRPVGLGEEAVTTVMFPSGPEPESGSLTEAVVRVDNVVLTVSYRVGMSQADRETFVRLARAVEDLAHVAVRNLGRV